MAGGVGPNDLILNSVAGATYSYSMLWTLGICYALNYVIAEATSRYVIVTGQTITEGYGRFGRLWMWALAFSIFIRRHLNNLAMILLLGASTHMLLPLPWLESSRIWALLASAIISGPDSSGISFPRPVRTGCMRLTRTTPLLAIVMPAFPAPILCRPRACMKNSITVPSSGCGTDGLTIKLIFVKP